MNGVTVAPAIFRVAIMVKSGSDARIRMTVVDDVGSPIVDSTGYSVIAQVKQSESSPVLFEWNMAPSADQGLAAITYSADDVKSYVELPLTGAQTELFKFGIALFECYITSPLPRRSCLAEGTFAVDPSIIY